MRTIKKVASHIFIDGFGGMTQGQRVNLEIDALARYVDRIRTAN